jgi:hypothetical protein
MITTMLDAIEWLIRGVFRLIISFIKTLLVFWAVTGLSILLLVGAAEALRPLGNFTTLAVLFVIALAAREGLLSPRGLFPERRSSSSPEAEDQAPSLPALPIPEHVPGATSIYRGRLTTLPPA